MDSRSPEKADLALLHGASLVIEHLESEISRLRARGDVLAQAGREALPLTSGFGEGRTLERAIDAWRDDPLRARRPPLFSLDELERILAKVGYRPHQVVELIDDTFPGLLKKERR